ncbi:MAG: phenylalanine--tRNA ligase subunit beta [Candidatus Saccharimonadales bacterium]
MKVSVNSVKKYLGFDLPNTAELVAKIGSQLGEVEHVSSIEEKYAGVIVAKVISCIDHPNADRLHVCVIDDGGKAQGVNRDEQGHVQVVCGAPNVLEGLTVAWLPPGATVPESFDKDPFVLEARELRGVVSNGMLASPKELGLGESHDGILELDDDKPAGASFAEVYQLDDTIIDIENKMFTHRPDCFGYLGVAREIAGIHGRQFKSPDWYSPNAAVPGVEAEGLPLRIENELPNLVARFCAITLRGVEIKPSPVWLQAELSKVGIRSINNVVDLTNYFMILTGQPLHAYDYDKVRSLSDGDQAVIVVRNPRENETITLLNGKTINPRQEAIMIATNQQLIGVGGVMGGSETEVDNDTKNIILEAATFDMYSIRRTSMEHGLFTDAVTRFSKGQSPLQNQAIIAKIIEEIRTTTGAKIAGDLIDINQVEGRKWVHPPVPVKSGFINDRLGLDISAEDMKTLLENVEFSVAVDGDSLTVTAPFWRTDVETREDVVEEVGRLYGFDKLPLVLPEKSIIPTSKDVMLELKNTVRENLVKSGANEVLTYSFVHGNLLEKVGQDMSQAFQLSNALSPDLQYYRLSLTPSLLDKIHPNVKAGYDEFALFELGKTHVLTHKSADEGLPTEFETLALVYTASGRIKKLGAAYYMARNYITNLAEHFGLELAFTPITEMPDVPVVKPYEKSRSAFVHIRGNDALLGIVGEYSASTRKNLKLSEQTAGFEIDLEVLQKHARTASRYTPLPRFPQVTQDITFKITADVAHEALFDVVRDSFKTIQPEQTRAALDTLGIYQHENDTAFKHVTFRLTIASYQKTLRDSDVTALLDEVAAKTHEALGAERA